MALTTIFSTTSKREEIDEVKFSFSHEEAKASQVLLLLASLLLVDPRVSNSLASCPFIQDL